MTGWAQRLEAERGGRGRWAGAALVVGLAYAGAVGWALEARQSPSPQAAAPAVMVDLSPEASAADSAAMAMGRQPQAVPDTPSPDRAAPDAAVTPPRPATAPAQDIPPAVPAVGAAAPVLRASPPGAQSGPQSVAVLRPDPPPPEPANPARPPPAASSAAPDASPRPHDRPAVSPARSLRASRSANRSASQRAAAPVRQAARTTAPRSSAGQAASSRALADWHARLEAHLMRYKRYPAGARARGEAGVVTVMFRLDPAGQVVSVRVIGSSGHADLDAAVVAMVRRASPMPAPPPGAELALTAPIRFTLN
ncbi:energy transducer TonB [Acidimangrovimonas sediminis]|uniref:energy transducer TonB n=1 Tax=Acidimangrovimonas sediminis TaxID=2056283 RepID=UPI0011AFBA1D|nr:energy transducer TonB [Acidimangrovimonas sediminis]